MRVPRAIWLIQCFMYTKAATSWYLGGGVGIHRSPRLFFFGKKKSLEIIFSKRLHWKYFFTIYNVQTFFILAMMERDYFFRQIWPRRYFFQKITYPPPDINWSLPYRKQILNLPVKPNPWILAMSLMAIGGSTPVGKTTGPQEIV